MNENIKKWYLESYPSDELGNEINDSVTFQDVFNALDRFKSVYKVLGNSIDSVVRERVFEKLSDIMEVPYEYNYNQWLLCEE